MKLRMTIFSALLIAIAQSAGAAHISYDCAAQGGTNCDGLIPSSGTAGTTISSFDIGTVGSIADIDIFVNLNHTFTGDLDITISHNGTDVVLFDQTNGTAADNIFAIFDDEAGTPIGAGSPDYGGLSYIPSELLAAFDGMDLSGTWTLTINDVLGGDSGALVSWGVDAATVAGPMPTPEPGILVLLGMGLAGLGFARRRS